ncbi:MAG: hypothetical protein M1828_005373 [Chrysothrix sp. TS-e1954]|nr:MAG: hypothetical protein M1828_005373 [Chrysothrix sp. TS-e1954]
MQQDKKLSRPYRLGLYYSIAANILFWVIFRDYIKIEVEVDEDEAQAEGEEEIELPDILTQEDTEAGTFIPLWLPQGLPIQPYKQSDPDWQEFQKLSKDSDRGKAVKKQLADTITADASKQLRPLLGENVHHSRYWLDFIYPDFPPPEYVRRGLFFSDDYGLLLTNQKIPHSEYVRINHHMKPTAYYRAARDSARLMYDLQSIRVKGYMGLQLNKHEAKSQVLYQNFQARARILMLNLQKEEQAVTKRQAQQEKNAKDFGGSLQPPAPAKVDGDATGAPSDDAKKKSWSLQDLDLSIPLYLPEFPIPLSLVLATNVFRASLHHNTTLSRWDKYPKGCVFVFGDVEVVGSKRKAKLDVFAAYDPKDGHWSFVKSQKKFSWELKQRPKGGQ